MAKAYRPVVWDQAVLAAAGYGLVAACGSSGTRLVIRAVERMDTLAFHAGRRTGHAGTAGYDPDMLVTLLVWAYVQGVASSRRMEDLCGWRPG